MYEYTLSSAKAASGDTVDGLIDLGFGIFVRAEIRLAGIIAPLPRLDKSISDRDDRLAFKKRGLKALKRLKELLLAGQKEPEGLVVQTFTAGNGCPPSVTGDIKYIYARDLYNFQPGESPWVGWKSIATQLLQEELVDYHL